MFNEVKEMIDSTIYTNGRGEVTAQNVNLAMHGIIDAVEDQVDQMRDAVDKTNGKIAELDSKIEEASAGGAGGLNIKIPGVIMTEFIEPSSANELVFDREAANILVQEFPTLKSAVDELFEYNLNALAKYKEALEKGEKPILTFDFAALYNEILAAIGEPIQYNLNMIMVPTFAEGMIAGSQMMLFAMGSIMNMPIEFGIDADGTIAMMAEGLLSATVYIPVPGTAAIDNSDALSALNSHYSTSYLMNDFMYSISEADGNSIQEPIVPVHVKQTKANLFFRFVINTDIVEAYINKQSGMTKSRVVGTMNPVNVETVPEALISRVNDLTYPYYEIFPAEGGMLTLKVESNVLFRVMLDGAYVGLTYEAGSRQVQFAINQNSTGQEFMHHVEILNEVTGQSYHEVIATYSVLQRA